MTTARASAFLVATFLCLNTLTSARADFIPISNPGDPYPLGGTYLSSTHLIPITATEFSTVSSITEGILTASFSAPAEVLSVASGSWSTWSSPPLSEDPAPTVLWTQGLATLTITFSTPVNAFGVELEPNQVGLPNLPMMTATFFSGGSTSGSIVRPVDGNGGALLFAAAATSPSSPFTSVTLSNDSGDFGIAQFRYSTPSSVPEPSQLVLLIFTLPGLIGFTHFYRRFQRA